MKNISESFHIRSYQFNELAMLYFPNVAKHSATKQLRRWININSSLKNELHELSCPARYARWLTPQQVAAIIKYLGDPGI